MKRCSRCRETKPLTLFSRSSKEKSGRRSECKACQAEEKRRYRAANRSKHNEYNREWARKNPEKARAIMARYRGKDPSEIRPRPRRTSSGHGSPSTPPGAGKWSRADPVRLAATKAEWRRENSDRVREQKQRHHALHAAKIVDRVQRWRQANPERRRAQNAKRRARKASAAGTDYTTFAHITARAAMFGFRCYYCGGPYESIDHRIPLARGGSHWPANLVPACRRCNSAKNARTEREHLAVLAGRG